MVKEDSILSNTYLEQKQSGKGLEISRMSN